VKVPETGKTTPGDRGKIVPQLFLNCAKNRKKEADFTPKSAEMTASDE